MYSGSLGQDGRRVFLEQLRAQFLNRARTGDGYPWWRRETNRRREASARLR
jgi:hypothetical protein